MFRRSESFLASFLWTAGALALLGSRAAAQVATVEAEQKISASQGGFGGVIAPNSDFGRSLAMLGDLDGDGLQELAVGVAGDDGAAGAVWILSLNADGTVASETKIGEGTGGFGGVLDTFDLFGSSLAAVGDLNGDGTIDLAVGAQGDDDGGSNAGAVWILFLKPEGTVAAQTKISETTGGFSGALDPNDFFGHSLAALGQLDGSDELTVAVGSRDDDGGTDQGAFWVLFLNANGTVSSHTKVSETTGSLGNVLDPEDLFGHGLALLGDVDGDGNQDLAVGAPWDDDGGLDQGAVWILFLHYDGSVDTATKISETTGGFGGVLDPFDYFGGAVAACGDLDGNGTTDLLVGADLDDDGDSNQQGAAWILFLDPDGTVKSEQKISETAGGFGGALDFGELFGWSVGALGDLDGDGFTELAVGVPSDDDGVPGVLTGAVWILFLQVLQEKPQAGSSAGPLGSVVVTLPLHADPSASPPARPADTRGLEDELELSFRHPPRAGEAWQVWVDVSAHPTARSSHVWVSQAGIAGRAAARGELLVDILARGPHLRSSRASSAGIDVHSFAIPRELAGQTLSLQALILDAQGSSLSKAIDVVVRP